MTAHTTKPLWTKQTIDGSEPWGAYGLTTYRFPVSTQYGFPPKKNGQTNIICDRYVVSGYNSNAYCALPTGQTLYDTVDALKAALAASPAEICYELATPIPISLTPQEVESLADDNTMWTDGDSLTVEYRAN